MYLKKFCIFVPIFFSSYSRTYAKKEISAKAYMYIYKELVYTEDTWSKNILRSVFRTRALLNFDFRTNKILEVYL